MMSLLIPSAEGVVRRDRRSEERGGGGFKKKSQLKLKNATKWNKDECSTEPHTEYKRHSREIYMAGVGVELNAKLHLYLYPAVAALTLSLLIISENLGIKPTAAICPTERHPARWGKQRQEGIEGKKPSLIFNKVWWYFSLSVMPLLLQIGLAVKAIDCEPAPQLGHRRGKQRQCVSC